MTDPFDRFLDEEDAMCEDADPNALHGQNTDEEMDVDGMTPGAVLLRIAEDVESTELAESFDFSEPDSDDSH